MTIWFNLYKLYHDWYYHIMDKNRIEIVTKYTHYNSLIIQYSDGCFCTRQMSNIATGMGYCHNYCFSRVSESIQTNVHCPSLSICPINTLAQFAIIGAI